MSSPPVNAPRSPSPSASPEDLAYNVPASMSHPSETTSRAERISGIAASQMIPAGAYPGPAGHVASSAASISSSSSSSHPPLLPLLKVSIIDLLEVDPRPSFVVSLSPAPSSAVAAAAGSEGSRPASISGSSSSSQPSSFTPSVVYCNPALTDSSALRDIITAPKAKHAVIWADVEAVAEDHDAEPLASVMHLGFYWTRTVLGGIQYAVFSANPLPSADAAVGSEPLQQPSVPKSALAPAQAEGPASATPAQNTALATRPGETRTAEERTALPKASRSMPRPPQPQLQPQPPTPPASAVFSPREDDASQGRETPSASTEQTTIVSDSDVPEQRLVAPEGDNSEAIKTGTVRNETEMAPEHGTETSKYLRQFEAITQFMPVGMCIFDAAGNVSFANDAWYHIMGCPPVPEGTVMTRDEFLSYVEEEDQEAVYRFSEQTSNVPNVTFGFRIKKYGRKGSTSTKAASSTTQLAPSLISAASSRTTTPLPSQQPSPPTAADSALRASPHSAQPTQSTDPENLVPRESHVVATAYSERAESGQLIRTLVCLRDVTEHQNIAEAADRHAQQASNLRRMAEFATVGMYDIDVDGRLRGANRVFYEMCGLENAEEADLSREFIRPWLKCVEDEDQPLVQACLDRIVAGGDHQTAELRFKKPWTSDDGAGNRIIAPRWIEATFLPVTDSDGKVQSITGCLSDVSLRRWQLERERQVKEEAIESKRQQENFVDITSHEIRNPLTVIMHCGDAVLECLTKIRESNEQIQAHSAEAGGGTESEAAKLQKSLLEDGIEYAEIIVSSALHQKSIVDDILTMSKLDSELLAVTPVTVNPIEIVRSTLKMFEVQARQQNIQLYMSVDPSYDALASPYLILDPSRVKQILINLLTNALKFTRSVNVREVTTTVSVSHTRPTDEMCSVSFVPGSDSTSERRDSGASASSKPLHPAQRVGESVFLIFEVKDTGEGLTKEGMDSLFQKFVQADSSTHVKHGGSGLGLFISKRLAEIQNGAIGVASQPGVGSTFAFYIEASIPPSGVAPDLLSPGEAAKIALATGLGTVSGQAGALHEADDPAAARLKTHETSNTYLTSTGDLIQSKTIGPPLKSNASTLPMVPVGSTANRTPGSKTIVLSEDARRSAGGELATVPESPPEIRGVLLVEDNIVNQKVTRRYFEKSGFQVHVAANGIEALDKIKQSDRCVPGSFPVSVVLMDMEMPVQDGLTCTRHIRALEAAGTFSGGRIPILMITGNARPEQLAEARAAGCDDVVVKPFQMHSLFEHIQLVMHTLWEEDVRTVGLSRKQGESGAAGVAATGAREDEEDREKGDETSSRPLDEGVALRKAQR